MRFSWMLDEERKGIQFKKNGSFSMCAAEEASGFSTEEEARAALAEARQKAEAKWKAENAAARARVEAQNAASNAQPARGFGFGTRITPREGLPYIGFLGETEKKLRTALGRLESARLQENQAKPGVEAAVAQSVWAVVVENGSWMQMRSGRCALAKSQSEATLFDSEEAAVETARECMWTVEARPQESSACVVELQMRIQSAKPVAKGARALNAFAAQWMALKERDELSAQTQKAPPPSPAEADGQTNPSDSAKKRKSSRL